MLLWKEERHIVEVKLRLDTETEEEANEQILRYLDTDGQTEGWLALFDLREGLDWSERLYQHDETIDGKLIYVIGC